MAFPAGFVDALARYDTITSQASDDESLLSQKYAALDPNAPNALEQYRALEAEFQAFRTKYNALINEASAAASAFMVPGLSVAEHNAMVAEKNKYTAAFNTVVRQTRTWNPSLKEQIKNLEAKAAEKTVGTGENADGAAEGGATAANPQNDDGAAEGGNTAATAAANVPANAPSNDDSTTAETEATPAGGVATEQSNPAATTVDVDSKTGRLAPVPNPLSSLSSYAYDTALYMVDMDVMNNFIASGGTGKGFSETDPKVRVVARSGGYTTGSRPLTSLSGQGRDYYLDDLNMTTLLPGGTNRATVSTEIKFKITEPQGFAFLQDLTRAGLELNQGIPNGATNTAGVNQHYILGIRFNGYDVSGQPAPADTGGTRFLSIKITKIKFKLDGKAVSYQVDAVVLAESIANGQVNGVLKVATTLTGKTVGEVLSDPKNNKSLVGVLNSISEAAVKEKTSAIQVKYAIEFIGDAIKIANEKILDNETFDKKMGATYSASEKERSNIAAQFKSNGYNRDEALFQLAAGQSVLTIIDNVIIRSGYVTEALTQITNANTESRTTNNPVTRKLEWYSVNPIVKVIGMDSATNAWKYQITYQIKTFKVPYVRLTTAKMVSTYPGAKKRYDYWLTGLNTEIISYEQQYDNLYYVVSMMGQQEVEAGRKPGNAPIHEQAATGANPTSSENKNMQYNKNAAAQLYGGDIARARIKIMGDPDYIMTNTGVDNSSATFGAGPVIDPLAGQAFIEINFRMGDDYKDDGTLDINGNIQFYGTETMRTQLRIDGVVYKVFKVESVFSRGAFTQTLECYLVDQTQLTFPVGDGRGGAVSDSRPRGSDGYNETPKPNPNQTAATLKRAGVAQNMVGRQGGNASGLSPSGSGTGTGAGGNTDARQSVVKKQPAATPSVVTNKGQQAIPLKSPNDDAVPFFSQPKPATNTNTGR